MGLNEDLTACSSHDDQVVESCIGHASPLMLNQNTLPYRNGQFSVGIWWLSKGCSIMLPIQNPSTTGSGTKGRLSIVAFTFVGVRLF